MGISGLLPLLKSVQKPVHLSELAGKTIAVDAYVWLHRGAYACAAEIVTGKPTTKYVDYAMHRVRLLQYHKITPYVVFDGGPLPAKKGTEVERKRKRDEHLTLANAFARQGKHSQAREHYVKCVDITPQMAFQLIKALRAEEIPYVVAPYEADAQLYHLESTGLVDGILTEDSDLLIFGTQLLLLKLDSSTAMCTAITATTLASNSPADLPLHGWGVKELRECAMLSGCDYIDGVRGVGLKTASKYLRKWGTVEKALRALRMDGKTVGRDWEERMRKAEVGFLNQRVWNPLKAEIVYLAEPDWATWDDERESFVGGYIEAELAGGLARGDIDPITLEPMVDIVPSFQPHKHPSRPRPLAFRDHNRQTEPVGGDLVTPAKGSLFQYFSKRSKNLDSAAAVSPVHLLPPPKHTMQIGRASGKRTLAEQYDREISVKRLKLTDENVVEGPVHNSKFFTNITVTAFSSRPHVRSAFDDDKENLEGFEDLDEVDEALVLPPEEDIDMMKQEGVYMSPSPVLSSPGRMETTSGIEQRMTPELSSPIQSRSCLIVTQRHKETAARTAPRRGKDAEPMLVDKEAKCEDEDAVWGSSDDRITSPPTASRTPRQVRMVTMEEGQVHIAKFSPYDITEQVSILPRDALTVDLRDIFAGPSGSSDLERAGTSPITPPDRERINCAIAQPDDIEDDTEAETQLEERHKIVAAGWEKRFSNAQSRVRCASLANETNNTMLKGKSKANSRPPLRRCETMATPLHPGVPRRSGSLLMNPKGQNNKPRLSGQLPQAMNVAWTTVRLASGPATQRTEPEDIDAPEQTSASPSSSQKAVVDDPGTATVEIEKSGKIKLQAYRFR